MKKETQEKRRREKEKNEKDLASLVVVLLEEEATIVIARGDGFHQVAPEVIVRVGAFGVFMQSRKGKVVDVYPHLSPASSPPECRREATFRV